MIETSIVTACMNRNQNLRKALVSWLAVSSVSEIIIIDWNSKISVYDNLIDIIRNDDRVKVFRVKGISQWVLSTAFNIGFHKASGKKILKLDADIVLQKDFFHKHLLKKGFFFAGNGKKAKNENERFLNGICYCFKDDLEKVNGYNEYIRSYGFDDDDLYNRLQMAGLKKLDVDSNSVYHIPHENRHSSQNQFLKGVNIPDKKLSWIKNLTNQILVEKHYQWDKDSIAVTYTTVQKSGYMELHPVDFQISSPSEENEKMAKCEALREALVGNENISKDFITDFNDNDILNLYRFLYNDDNIIQDNRFSNLLRDLLLKSNRNRVYLWNEFQKLNQKINGSI